MVEVRQWRREDSLRFVRAPGPDDDKYSRGVVALRTGSAEFPGAAVLSVEAAWRAGAGYVRYVGSARDAVLARRPETVAADDLGRTRADAWVLGSGTDAATRTAEETAALRGILRGEIPVVVDAGALDLAPEATAPVVVTPHAGEFSRLRERLGLETGADRVVEAVQTAQALGSTLLLKGSRTLVASPDGVVIELPTAPGWLATAGSGDVLAGVLGAVIAANPDAPLAPAAAAGAWLHARAARIAAGMSDGPPGHPIVALDVAEALPSAIGDLLS
ncbi:ADP/ATP-dependent (S)-NAD(P)H-hydrate dehydratase [Microbacterium sp. CIAB417]|uniref:ADP-dependent NAD(P)H-hydrate dehydratase n=1 Tax=Microbacterium sp. CIAB417 TaxID=2860287 RepID=UPI001FABCA5C|nr:ADP/ATP-dependent (S)-NAD(P)H-hydrate dehydratase [Microbacterium sp. CIAB417]